MSEHEHNAENSVAEQLALDFADDAIEAAASTATGKAVALTISYCTGGELSCGFAPGRNGRP